MLWSILVVLALAFVGCLESNPQPSPVGRQDIGGPGPGPGGGGEKGADGTATLLDEIESEPPHGPDVTDRAADVSGWHDGFNFPEMVMEDVMEPWEVKPDLPDLTDASDLTDMETDFVDAADAADLLDFEGSAETTEEVYDAAVETIEAEVVPDDVGVPAPCNSHSSCGIDEVCLEAIGADWPVQQVCGLCGEEEECFCKVPEPGDFESCDVDDDCKNNWCGDMCDDCGPCPPCVKGYCIYETFDVPECVCTPCA